MSSGLTISGLTVRAGSRTLLDGVDLTVAPGRIEGLIGPNGAGKTTLLDAVSGFRPATGALSLDGTSLADLPPHLRVRARLARTWQAGALFGDLTVAEHLRLAGGGIAPGDVGLAAEANALPGRLSPGQRGLLGLGRALATRPKALLLDEPAAGLDADDRRELSRRLRTLAAGDLGILLVDHDMQIVLSLCDEVTVLDRGRVLTRGTPATIRSDREVRRAYLGEDTPAPARRAPRELAPRLEVQHASAGYDSLTVVHDVSLTVGAGEVLAMLGPNGAGKTTLLRAVARTIPMRGAVLLDSRPVPWRTEKAARAGLGLVLAGRGAFPRLTVRENLRLAAPLRAGRGDEVLELFPSLRPLLPQPAGTLSGGEQQQLTLARALLRRPRALLVDEPSTGLAPALVGDLLAALRRLADERGTAVLLVEQSVGPALAVADRAVVLDRGRIALEGTANELATRADLVESAYLGSG